jgi:hypothetical protein
VTGCGWRKRQRKRRGARRVGKKEGTKEGRKIVGKGSRERWGGREKLVE